MMNMNTVQNSKPPGLVRGLGLWSAIAVVIGSMIGQAVFLVGSDMAQELGSVTRLLAALTIGGGFVVFRGLLLCRAWSSHAEGRRRLCVPESRTQSSVRLPIWMDEVNDNVAGDGGCDRGWGFALCRVSVPCGRDSTFYMACDPFLAIATIPVHPYGWTASRGSGGRLARSQQLSRSTNGGTLPSSSDLAQNGCASCNHHLRTVAREGRRNSFRYLHQSRA